MPNAEHDWLANTRPLRLGSENPCGHRQPAWPHNLCNLDLHHKGPHCCVRQLGSQVVRVWWDR